MLFDRYETMTLDEINHELEQYEYFKSISGDNVVLYDLFIKSYEDEIKYRITQPTHKYSKSSKNQSLYARTTINQG